MSKVLSAKEFRDFVELYVTNHADHSGRFDKVDKRLGKVDKRLDTIEKLLWQGQRIDDHERRIIKLAEIVGAADLASPMSRPIGS